MIFNFWLTLNRIPNDFHAQIKPTLKKKSYRKKYLTDKSLTQAARCQ